VWPLTVDSDVDGSQSNGDVTHTCHDGPFPLLLEAGTTENSNGEKGVDAAEEAKDRDESCEKGQNSC